MLSNVVDIRARLLQRQGGFVPYRSQNRHSFTCEGPHGHDGPHYSAAATRARSNGVWVDERPEPPRVA